MGPKAGEYRITNLTRLSFEDNIAATLPPILKPITPTFSLSIFLLLKRNVKALSASLTSPGNVMSSKSPSLSLP